MRQLMLTAALAATALTGFVIPATAQTTRGDVRDAQRHLHEERHELRDAYRSGDRREIRDEWRDVAKAEARYSRELRDYRRDHPRVYARNNWRADYRYRHWNRGDYMRPVYYSPRTVIVEPRHYRLPPAPRYTRWVRNYDDVLLVNIRTGRVLDIYYNFFF